MKHLFFYFVLGLLLISCSEQKESMVKETEVLADENYVAADVAEKIATQFLLGSDVIKRTKSYVMSKEITVKDNFSVSDEKLKPFIHVINYEGGGFVIVSGDNRLDPILAFSDDGCFNNNLTDCPGGLVDWLSSIRKTVQYVRNNKEELPSELKAYWSKYNFSLLATKNIKPPTDPCANLRYASVGPLLTTTWYQTSPFNALMPQLSCRPDGHALAGCVPIAIAQILKYYQYPSNYQWNQMPNTTASSYTQSLISGIHNFINMTSSISYDCDGTGVGTSYDIGKLLRTYFNYSSATQSDFNLNVAQNQLLNSNRPIIIRGLSRDGGVWPFYSYEGHAWVCDGVIDAEDCVEDEGRFIKVGILFFHMNWGWKITPDQNYNGWYGYGGGFNVAGNSFDHNLRMVYNIIP